MSDSSSATENGSEPSTLDLHDQRAVALAYLAYLGSKPEGLTRYKIAVNVMNDIICGIPGVSVLAPDKKPDWRIVWGPAFEFDLHDEKNMMYVARRLSKPNQYMVAVRGTNFRSLPNWLDDDLKVGETVAWKGPDGPDPSRYGSVSKGTHNDLGALTSICPLKPHFKPSKLPGAGLTLAEFLATVTGEPIELTFCGHSLAGAMAPTLALYFAQAQGPDPGKDRRAWDPHRNATIRVTAFAGPTPGDGAFARYMTEVIPNSSYARYNNLHDIVPHAWAVETYEKIPTLYSTCPEIEAMSRLERDAYDHYHKKIVGKEYTQTGRSMEFTFPLGKPPEQKSSKTTFGAEAGYQHHVSYPTHLGVKDVLTVLDEKKS